jgi:hypothetical protein
MKARVFGDVIPSSLTATVWRHPQGPSSEQKVKAAEGTKTLHYYVYTKLYNATYHKTINFVLKQV